MCVISFYSCLNFKRMGKVEMLDVLGLGWRDFFGEGG